MKTAYETSLGRCFHTTVEQALADRDFSRYKGKFALIFTSPPFPLNRKKKYGNRVGKDYVDWLTGITTSLGEYLTPNGSLVIEIGNAWEPGAPLMSTLPLETLLSIKKEGSYNLCQQFVWFNPAKLPGPAQWVTVKRVRVKDAFTNIWWMSKSSSPFANNRRVVEAYSGAMKKLIASGKYNAGARPSEHAIGADSFLTDHGGSIPSNVLVAANTSAASEYLDSCKESGLLPHPARMPLFLPDFFINFLTRRGQLILDPFAGSNSTGAVAEKLGRKWVSIEADASYVEGSKGRFAKAI